MVPFVGFLQNSDCKTCKILTFVVYYGTIHLRRRQIFTIFDPYPPPVGNHRHSSKMPPPPSSLNTPLYTIFTNQTKGALYVGVV
jgi:hypothetical protein